MPGGLSSLAVYHKPLLQLNAFTVILVMLDARKTPRLGPSFMKQRLAGYTVFNVGLQREPANAHPVAAGIQKGRQPV